MTTDTSDLCYISATDALKQFEARTLSSRELVQAVADRSRQVNPKINAYTYAFYDRALQAAEKAEARYRKGTNRPLEGIPLVVKDSNAVAGEITTYGSKIYADYRPKRTHPGVQRLLDSGAILLARSTMPEFGEAGNCYTPLWGVTRNPWNTEFGPGGSSSGAGASLAAGMTTLADGSDIGGSIRIPAACCGVVGYKPPYGRNPNPYESSFDPYMHYGPLARTVSDIALMQNITAGISVEDIGTVREKVHIPDRLGSVRGWKIAYSVDLGYFQVDNEVRKNMLDTLTALRDAGCQVEEVELGWTEEAYDAWYTVNGSHGSAARKVPDVEHWRPHLADYTLDVLDTGIRATNDQLIRALEVHVEMYRTLGVILEKYNAFICPTNAIPSVGADRSPLDLDFKINGEQASRVVASAWFMTYPFNMLSQLPVMSVPSGFSSSRVPTGIQIVGPSFDDLSVFQVAAAVERERPWNDRRPEI
jgi:amidase